MFIHTLDGVKNCKIHFYKLWAKKEDRIIVKTSKDKEYWANGMLWLSRPL